MQTRLSLSVDPGVLSKAEWVFAPCPDHGCMALSRWTSPHHSLSMKRCCVAGNYANEALLFYHECVEMLIRTSQGLLAVIVCLTQSYGVGFNAQLWNWTGEDVTLLRLVSYVSTSHSCWTPKNIISQKNTWKTAKRRVTVMLFFLRSFLEP